MSQIADVHSFSLGVYVLDFVNVCLFVCVFVCLLLICFILFLQEQMVSVIFVKLLEFEIVRYLS